MILGYDKSLYLLPFDHRQSYVTEMFHFEPPLDASQRDQVIDSKQLIDEGFSQALAEGVPFAAAGILADEEFGTAILRDARQRRRSHTRSWATTVAVMDRATQAWLTASS